MSCLLKFSTFSCVTFFFKWIIGSIHGVVPVYMASSIDRVLTLGFNHTYHGHTKVNTQQIETDSQQYPHIPHDPTFWTETWDCIWKMKDNCFSIHVFLLNKLSKCWSVSNMLTLQYAFGPWGITMHPLKTVQEWYDIVHLSAWLRIKMLTLNILEPTHNFVWFSKSPPWKKDKMPI